MTGIMINKKEPTGKKRVWDKKDHRSERKAWLEKLQFLSDALESTSQPFGAGGPDGSTMIFNEAFCRLTGYTREELYNINWATDLTTPGSRKGELEALEVLDRTHEPQRYEKCYRRKNGSIVPIELFSHVALDPQENTIFYYSFITDISERKQKEEELQSGNRAFKMLSKCNEAMIRAEDEPTLLNDICNIVVEVGGYRLAWIGYIGEDEMRTVKPVARFGYDNGYVDNLRIALNDPIRGSGPTGISLKSGKPYGSRNVRLDGKMQPWRDDALKRGYLSTLNLPIMYEKQILGTLVIYSSDAGSFDEEELGLLQDLADNLAYGVKAIRDRVGRDKAEKDLQRANDELESRIKERTKDLIEAKQQAELYLDLMGHDISNMHQIIMGQLELAEDILSEDGKLVREDKELIDTSLETLERSTRLIDNVRNLQKLRSGEFNDEAIDIGELLSDIVSEYDGILPHNTIRFLKNGQHWVKANKLLHDVFSNLIGNAIKHSNGNLIEITINLEKAYENNMCYSKVSVADNGSGIPEDMKDKIFNRLQRGETKARGMGLGLYIARTLVESYGGFMDVEDRVPGEHTKGAKFMVYLPVEDEHV